MEEDKCMKGFLFMRCRYRKFFLSISKSFIWKRYYFVLNEKNSELLFYKKSNDSNKLPKNPRGKITLKHTFINVISPDSSVGNGFLFTIIPLVIDYDKLSSGLEASIGDCNPLDEHSNAIILSADTEIDLTSWVSSLLKASALFIVNERISRKKLALLVQDSIRDPLKNISESDLIKLTPRFIEESNEIQFDNNGDKNSNNKEKEIKSPVISYVYVKNDRIKLEALDNIFSFWKSIILRNKFLEQKRSCILLQSWWKYVNNRQLYVKKHKSIYLLQRTWRRHIILKRYLKDKKKMQYRKNIIQELLTTEFFYVDGLNTAITEFKKPLYEMAEGTLTWDGSTLIIPNKVIPLQKRNITKEQLEAIFSNIESIYTLHRLFLDKLEKRLDTELGKTQTGVGDIFQSLAIQFKVYIQFINNYNNALSLIESIQTKDPKFKSFLVSQSGTLTGPFYSLSLESLLILPVQRLPRYELLLGDIIRYTWEEHIEYNHLKEALKAVNTMTVLINESKRIVERMEISLEIQKKFTNLKEDLVLPHRKYIKHGSLLYVERGENIGRRYLFLFTDILIIGEEKTRAFSNTLFYEQKDVLTLSECDVITLEDNIFNIGTSDGKVSYSFQAESSKEKDEWFKEIHKQTEFFINNTNNINKE